MYFCTRFKSILKNIPLDTLCRILSGIIEDLEQLTEKEDKLRRLDKSRDQNELIQFYLSFIPAEYHIESTRRLIKLLKVDSNHKPSASLLEKVAAPHNNQPDPPVRESGLTIIKRFEWLYGEEYS